MSAKNVFWSVVAIVGAVLFLSGVVSAIWLRWSNWELSKLGLLYYHTKEMVTIMVLVVSGGVLFGIAAKKMD